MKRDAVIVEVGVNEGAVHAQNPNVPYGPKEGAQDARSCVDAGAAVVHRHARDPVSGEQRLGDIDLSLEYQEPMARAGVLAYPSYPVSPQESDPLAHCWALHERCGLEMAPTDLGSVNLAFWDPGGRRLHGVDSAGYDGVHINTTTFVQESVIHMYSLGMVPSLGSFDGGHTRTMVHLAHAGVLREPIFLKIFLCGAWATGPFPSVEALDLHLAQIPDDLDVEWVMVPYMIDDPALIEQLSRHALERGGGISVGVGDNPDAFPDATNSDLVETASGWVASAGRQRAAGDDVRSRLLTGAGSDG